MQTTTNPPLTKSLLWLMTIATGLIVANLYYNQPLLHLIAKDFNVNELRISKIAMLTQIGYAVGLLFIVPLGDKMLRKRLILTDLVFVIISMFGMAYAPSVEALFILSFVIGFTSVIPQVFVPMAAELATAEKRSETIGLVMSGLLIGILLSRVISGIVGDLFGWRSMYLIGSGLMILIWIALFFMLPEMKPTFKGSYSSLMRTVWELAKTQPLLRLASFRGAMGFASMSAVFTTLVFHMEEAPFYASASIVGSFGLIGAVGALAAAFVGKLNTFIPRNRLITYGLSLVISSWGFLYFGGFTYTGLIIGIILIDLGLQASHIMNQSDFFSLTHLNANSRLNTVYMVCYFIGGSLGTWAAGYAWSYAQWTGVCVVGVGFACLGIVAHLIFKKPSEQAIIFK